MDEEVVTHILYCRQPFHIFFLLTLLSFLLAVNVLDTSRISERRSVNGGEMKSEEQKERHTKMDDEVASRFLYC